MAAELTYFYLYRNDCNRYSDDLVENVIGRRIKVNAIDAFGGTANGKKIASGWKILGYMGLLGAFGILAYYMVLGGWVLIISVAY
ncbi:putative sodium-dependent transporter [Actinobacillus equuli]|nr:putative sodium-dependent transporter [Actinobacillus equuli]